MAKICSVIVLLMVGCSSAVESQPEVKSVDTDSFISSVNVQAKAIATTLAAQKLTGEQTLETAQAIMAKLNTMEASLVVPKAEPGKEVIKSAPNPPAKANTALAPLKVATPGDFSEPETLVELATRLHARGVSVHMKTEDQLRAIDAQMLGTKSTPVQYQSRPTYSRPSGTVCIDGQCFTPQRVSRKRR
jgi:hypothetical protein